MIVLVRVTYHTLTDMDAEIRTKMDGQAIDNHGTVEMYSIEIGNKCLTLMVMVMEITQDLIVA